MVAVLDVERDETPPRISLAHRFGVNGENTLFPIGAIWLLPAHFAVPLTFTPARFSYTMNFPPTLTMPMGFFVVATMR